MVEIGRLFWKKVVTADDFVIGEIESAELDTNTWQLKSFYVSLNDETNTKLGFERPYFGKIFVCLPVSTVKEVGDFAVLNKTFAELQELKECKK
jgi:sporulation protein YlmC with PRC-barrel domain